MKLALQMLAGILSKFFDVSFYASTQNYSLFALLFSEQVAGTVLSSLYKFYQRFHDETRKKFTIQTKHYLE
jgi:uncharacterized membrane-anchored protein